METLNNLLANFHFLRPWWFAALLPALLLAWLQLHRTRDGGQWAKVIAPELLPYLLAGSADSRYGRRRPLIWLLGWLLAISALAGPTWRQIPLPVHQQQHALVILFDLSPSMLAQDVTPNRLTRARLKLVDILKQRKEGTTALIAYSGDAFTVSPLTDDANTVAALVPALHPGIMPELGSNTEAAVDRALLLLKNAGQASGDLLLITDGITPTAREYIDTQLRDQLQIDVSVLAVGTPEGAPIPLGNGSFIKDSNGAIVVPTLDSAPLKYLTERLDGHYAELRADDSDINYLLAGLDANPQDDDIKTLERTFDTWEDQGFWLALACLPLLALAFRRGLVAVLLLAPLLATPRPAMALEWSDLWQRRDQRGSEAFQQEQYDKAQQLFEDQQWRAASAYRNNDYPAAAELFADDSPSGLYNRGNALAKAGRYQQAIEAYQQALEKQPEMEDAAFNKALLEKLLQQQQNKSQQQDQQNQKDQQNQQNQQNQQDQQSSQDSSGEQQNSEQNPQQNPQQSPQQSPQQRQTPQQQSEQQQSQAKGEQQQEQKQKQEQQQQDQQQQAEQNTQPSAPPDSQAGSQLRQKEMSDEEQQAMEQWLRRIPDDPGGLLREKFRYKYEQRRRGYNPPQQHSEQRW